MNLMNDNSESVVLRRCESNQLRRGSPDVEQLYTDMAVLCGVPSTLSRCGLTMDNVELW